MTPTLFIGLDGLTFHILDDLFTDKPGRGVVMPFLKKLSEGGFRSTLRSTPNPLTPPSWVSMVTGKNPGRHGVYDFMRAEDKGNEVFFTLYDYRDIRTETIWSMVNRQGGKVVSLNFPMMAPPPQVDGALIPGFTSSRHLRRNSVPNNLFERLKEIPDFDPKELAWDFERENEIGQEMDDSHLAKWIRYHLPREELWYQVARKLLTEDRPELLAVMFDGADKIMHQAWQFIDPDLEPQQPDDHFREMQALCMEYFSRLDSYIEGMVEVAGPESRVFLASDHGFTTTTDVVRINRYLSELGHLVYREVGQSDAEQRRANSPFAYLDWDKTVAFCPTPSSNGIHIRVAKEPGQPGIQPDEYDSFRSKLIEQLYELRDPGDGGQVITEVLLREDVFAGEAMEQAPDLTLVLRDFGFVSIRNLEPSVVQRNFPAGTHHPDGIFLASGPGIVDGEVGEGQKVADMTAAFLYSLGLPIPEDIDGRVPRAAFTTDQLINQPVVRGEPTLAVDDGKVDTAGAAKVATPSEEEKKKLLDQLAMLGYLEE